MRFGEIRGPAARAVLALGAAATAVTGAAGAFAAPGAPERAPALHVRASTVTWAPVAYESAYRIAVSDAPRGARSRSTTYATILRSPGALESYTPRLAPGSVAYIAVSADGGRVWSPSDARIASHARRRYATPRVRRRRHPASRPRSAPRPAPPVGGETTASGAGEEGLSGAWGPAAAAPAAPAPALPAPRLREPLAGEQPGGGAPQWEAPQAEPPTRELPHEEPPKEEPPKEEPPKEEPPKEEPPKEEPPKKEPPKEEPPKEEPPKEEPPKKEPPKEEPPKEEPPHEEPPVEEPPITEPPFEPPPGSHHPIIGTNDGSGWGPAAAATMVGAGINWDRFSVKAWAQSVSTSQSYGFNDLGIVNAVNDHTPLSQVEPTAWGLQAADELVAHPTIKLAEAGNESYLKGGVANPVQYGRMYMAAIRAMAAKHVHIPLLFNMTGDYPYGSWDAPTGWSEDSKGGGWLRTAVNAVPGLAAAIRANGVSIHPYGAVGANNHDDYGVNAAAADEAVAAAVLGVVPPVYITEFGYSLSACGRDLGACSLREQATKMRAAYTVFLSDPHVYGIWWYQSHDDVTGHFGFMTDSNAIRPAFTTLAAIALSEGQ